MNSHYFFIYEFIRLMNSYMNSGVPSFQMAAPACKLPGPVKLLGSPCPTLWGPARHSLSACLQPVARVTPLQMAAAW